MIFNSYKVLVLFSLLLTLHITWRNKSKIYLKGLLKFEVLQRTILRFFSDPLRSKGAPHGTKKVLKWTIFSKSEGSANMIKSRVKIKHFSIVGLMSSDWVRTQVRTHSDFCWTRGLGLGLWPTGLGLGLWSNGLGLGLGLWSNGLGLTPDGLGLWPDGLGLGLGLWPCGLGLTAGLTSPDSLQHCYTPSTDKALWLLLGQDLYHSYGHIPCRPLLLRPLNIPTRAYYNTRRLHIVKVNSVYIMMHWFSRVDCQKQTLVPRRIDRGSNTLDAT